MPSIAPYAIMLQQLIDGRVSGDEFEAVFLPFYKRDATIWPAELFDVLDGFFAALDDFQADPVLRGEIGSIGESELRGRAVSTIERLAVLAGGMSRHDPQSLGT